MALQCDNEQEVFNKKLRSNKVFTQGVIWGLNSFDQPGVEKGKKIAMDVLRVLDGKSDESFDQSTDAIIQRMR